MSRLSSAATDWIIGVFIVGALFILVRPGSPAVTFISFFGQLVSNLVGVVGGGPGTDPIIGRNG